MNLFDDVVVRARATYVGRTDREDSLQWRGELIDVPDSTVTLTAVGLCGGSSPALAGRVQFNGEQFAIRPHGTDRVLIVEYDAAAHGLSLGDHPVDDSLAAPALPRPPAPSVLREARVAPVMDVLVLYTPGAVKQAGSANAIEAEISDSVARANDALAESGVSALWRVVEMRSVKYTGPEDPVQAYPKLANLGDRQLDEAGPLRDQFGADMVTTVVGQSSAEGYAGMASSPANPSSATASQMWATVAADQLWASVLTHEWGHNLGLDHDWSTDPATNPSYPDNHGHLGAGFMTLMGYPSACRTPCEWIDRFSNPRLRYDGQPLGAALGSSKPADQARVLGFTAPVVANYRKAKLPLPAEDLTISAGTGGTAMTDSPGPYRLGDDVAVQAVAKPGYAFTGWTLDGKPAGTANPLSVTMSGDRVLTAKFGLSHVTRQLSTVVTPKEFGEISLDSTGPYPDGSQIVAVAKPKPGKGFVGWLLDGKPAGDGLRLTVTMSSAHTLTARFAPGGGFSWGANPGGTVAPLQAQPYTVGQDLIFKATPAKGYVFDRWNQDGKDVGIGKPTLAVRLGDFSSLTGYFKKG